jgi:hypothetical protein
MLVKGWLLLIYRNRVLSNMASKQYANNWVLDCGLVFYLFTRLTQ